MSDIDRRTFVRGLAGLFGAASLPDLRARILDNGSPILLKPALVSDRIFVAENGSLALGDAWDWQVAKRVTWLQYFVDCGARTRSDIMRCVADWDINPDDLDRLIDDDQWSGIFDMHYEPLAAAYHFLRGLKIGPRTLAAAPRNGRLDFFAGSNHPGSSDLWVEAWDDLSVSLPQARLIELHLPVELAMECDGSITKFDEDAYGYDPFDE